MARAGSRSLIYFLAVAVAAVSPLVYIPTVANQYGASGWAALATGQSIGLVVSAILSYDWAISGPPRAAVTNRAGQSTILVEALSSQCWLGLGALPVTCLICALTADLHVNTVVLMCLASATTTLIPTWLFIGAARPSHLLFLGSGGRLLGSIIGAGCVAAGLPLWVLPTVLLVANAASVLATVRLYTGAWLMPARSLRFGPNMALLKSQSQLARAWFGSAVYIHMPVFLASLFATNGLAIFAAGDRLFRFAHTGLGPLTQLLQGWVPRTDEAGLPARMRKAVAVHVIAGVIGGAAFPLLGPFAWRALFGDQVPVSTATLVIFGIALPVALISRSLTLNVLAVSGPETAITRSAMIGAGLALVLVPSFAYTMGAPGAAAAVAATELAVLAAQGPAAFRAVSGRSKAPSPQPSVEPTSHA